MRGTLAQSRLVVLARAVAERFRMDEIDTHAAALAYQLFLSTLAVSIAGLAILGLVARHSSVEVPAGAEEQWQNLIDGGVWLGLVALGGLLVTASGFGRRATRALAAVFRTGPVAGATGYARGLAVALGVIVLVGAVPIVTGILATLQAVGGLEVSGRVLGFGTTVALEFGLFLLAYVALTPGAGPPWRAYVSGAVLMTVGWELSKLAGGILLAYLIDKATLLYGTIGAIVGLLVFLRYAAWLFLVGAELSAVLAERRMRD
ncbi:MAG TPA: YhjD/YihY/BrkB family envelope integrity protein [Actinomycetota bacterium]|nr:YhjD/YihY/BrkB family envelope integrity protein [Actinomycetota bacterium]